jgi:G3E family GTPase
VTLVDAVNGAGQLDAQPSGGAGAIADRRLVTKADLAGGATVQALRARLQALNPHAAVAEAVQGEIDPAFFLDVGLRTVRADGAQLDRWLGSSGDGDGYLGKRLATGAHDRAIRSFVVWFDRPFSWKTFSSAMELLTSMRGPDLLRVKGLVNVEGERGRCRAGRAAHLPPPKRSTHGRARIGARGWYSSRGTFPRKRSPRCSRRSAGSASSRARAVRRRRGAG